MSQLTYASGPGTVPEPSLSLIRPEVVAHRAEVHRPLLTQGPGERPATFGQLETPSVGV